MSEVLRAEGLGAGYDGTLVVGDVRFSAEPGRVVTLIGPNGAGKSTVLKTLIRQLTPVAGTVYLNGRDLSGLRPRVLAQSVSAVLTGRPRPELMTCGDVVAAGRYPYTGVLGVLSESDRRAAAEAMALVNVTELRDRDFGRISDGQRQRVLLARAICQEPEVLVMDEPTSFLDLRHKLEFLYLLRQLVREKRLAAILSLHELDLAQRFSDTVLCIRDGAVDRLGPPEAVFRDGYIQKLYGVEHGGYDELLGCVEAGAVSGAPEVFVIGGGGVGVPLYRRLNRLGIPFAAGVLPENDADVPVARALAAELFTDRAFEPVGPAAVDRALTAAARCRRVVCALEGFGAVNRENRRILEAAEARGALISPEALEQ